MRKLKITDVRPCFTVAGSGEFGFSIFGVVKIGRGLFGLVSLSASWQDYRLISQCFCRSEESARAVLAAYLGSSAVACVCYPAVAAGRFSVKEVSHV